MPVESSAGSSRRAVRIGKYEVLSHIATGGMGAVYRAHDTELNREVALKVLNPEMAAKAAMVERFRREARAAAKFLHENIVTLYEFGEANGTYFLAMEFVQGIDLHELIALRGKLPEKEALDIVLQACRALDHLHRCGFIHRDVKPSNFLIEERDGLSRVKLTDMGLARELDNDEARVTRAGSTVGTLDYMAPEQARDSWGSDIRGDLYSLGATWFFLLAGQAPFPQGGLGERLLKIMNDPPPDVRKFNRRVSASTAAIIDRLLAKSPDDRFQTPAELLNELMLAEVGVPGIAPTEEPPPPKATVPIARRRQTTRVPTPQVRPVPEATQAPAKTDPTLKESPTPARRRKRKRQQRQSAGGIWWVLGGIALVLLFVTILFVVMLRWLPRRGEQPATDRPPPSAPSPATERAPAPSPAPIQDVQPPPPTTRFTPPTEDQPTRPPPARPPRRPPRKEVDPPPLPDS
jgi:serine/threonine protein kinase